MSEEVRIALASQAAAARVFAEGLEQGVVTARVDPVPEQGQEIIVVIEVSFAEALFRLKGVVVHAADDKTAIWIAAVPGDLKRLCIGAEETQQHEPAAPEASTTAVLTDTTLPSSPTQPDPDSRDSADADEVGRNTGPSSDVSGGAFPSGDEVPSLADLGLPSIGGHMPLNSRDSRSVSGDSESSQPSDYLSRRLRKEAEARKQAPRRTRWDNSDHRSRRGVEQALKAAPFVDGSGIAVPYHPRLRVPGIIAFESPLGGPASYDVFMRVLAQRMTGVAVWDVADGRYWTYLVGGGPVNYVRDPGLETESIESLLVRKKFVSEPVLEQARRLATLTGRPLVSVVMRLRLISEAQLFNLRGEQTRLVTEHLLDCTTGSVRVFQVPEIREVFQENGSDVLKMLWRHAARTHEALDSTTVRSRLEALKPKFISLSTAGKDLLHKLPLSSVQQNFVNRLLRPSRPVRKLFVRMEMHEVDAARLLLTLQQLGIVTLAARGAENQEDAEIERKLRERFGRVDRNVFGFLGLHWSALPEEMADALAVVDAELRQFSTIGDTLSNYDAMRGALDIRVEEIRGLIASREDRQRYRRRVVDSTEQYMAAETLLKQGELALFRRDRPQAKDCFSRLLEIDPGGSGSHDRMERARVALMQLEDGNLRIPE